MAFKKYKHYTSQSNVLLGALIQVGYLQGALFYIWLKTHLLAHRTSFSRPLMIQIGHCNNWFVCSTFK